MNEFEEKDLKNTDKSIEPIIPIAPGEIQPQQENASDGEETSYFTQQSFDENEGEYYEVEPKAELQIMPFKETVKRSGNKKYIILAVIAAVVNLSILAGLFGIGYQMGMRRRGFHSTGGVLANLQQADSDKNKDTANASQTVAKEGELTTVEISKKVGPAVVGVTSTIKSYTGIFGSSAYSEGTGSGIIISDDGYIVTNNHVIDGASSISVTINTGSEYEAEVIGSDPKTDLAVLKISPDEPLTVAELGDSSTLEVGERAVAIGNPLGMEFFGSTTQGIISAVNRTITVDNTTMTVIQTDAAINQGNSGGALVNSRGKVIGINAVKISSSTVEGMGFAIPISDARPVLQDLIKHGYVKGRPVIGITSRDVKQYMAERQNWPMGVQVMGVDENSGAAIAGLEQGDIITKADGVAVRTTNELNAIKDKHRAGETMELEVYKYMDGTTRTVKVKLMEQRP